MTDSIIDWRMDDVTDLVCRQVVEQAQMQNEARDPLCLEFGIRTQNDKKATLAPQEILPLFAFSPSLT